MVTAQALTDEETSIQNAEIAMDQAFHSVLEAEQAGGNVTDLLIRLNTAGQFLAEAQNIYKSGGSTSVKLNANSAKAIADQVNAEAIKLKEVHSILNSNNFWFIVTFSVGGAVVFGLLMLLIWQKFKTSYKKKLLSLKPEVIDNAA